MLITLVQGNEGRVSNRANVMGFHKVTKTEIKILKNEQIRLKYESELNR